MYIDVYSTQNRTCVSQAKTMQQLEHALVSHKGGIDGDSKHVHAVTTKVVTFKHTVMNETTREHMLHTSHSVDTISGHAHTSVLFTHTYLVHELEGI
jgi:uncharacterized coiled-coil protein SlyX